MERLNLVHSDRNRHVPQTEPQFITVPRQQYLMYDGTGRPEGNDEFRRAFQALYGVAYTLKFMPKRGHMPENYQDFKMPSPEGLWWTATQVPFEQARSRDWRWTLMLRMPDWVNPYLVAIAKSDVVGRKHDNIYGGVHLHTLTEGRVVQIMHIGPYETEAADIARMHAFAEAQDMAFVGKHHEIYNGDPRRTAPEKLRTVLRRPVRRWPAQTLRRHHVRLATG